MAELKFVKIINSSDQFRLAHEKRKRKTSSQLQNTFRRKNNS